MGMYNQKEQVNKIERIKEGKCPICDNQINTEYNPNPETDSFEYKCNKCGQEKIISIAGSLLFSENYLKIINNTIIKNYLKAKIENTKTEIVCIDHSDFN